MRTFLLASLLLMSMSVGATVPTGFVETSYTSTALTLATGMAWAPDGSGRLFILIKNGTVRLVSLKDGVPETQGGTLVTRVFATEPAVYTNSECGLIGIAFDPNYVVNRYVYLFVTASPRSEQQIVRYTDANGVGTARTVIVDACPRSGRTMTVARLGFGPDGKLYWAIGDLGNGTGVDADLTSLAAKVGRANLDGTPVNDNPFNDGVGPNNEYIWARGFRNPFTFTFQPGTGKLWVNSVGTSYEQIFVPSRADHAGYNAYENNQPAGFITPVIKYRTNGTDTRTLTASGAVRSGRRRHLHHHRGRTASARARGSPSSGVTDASFNGSLCTWPASPSPTTCTAGAGGAGRARAAVARRGRRTWAAPSRAAPSTTPRSSRPVYRGNFFFGDYNSGQVTRATLAADNSVATVDEWGTGFSAKRGHGRGAGWRAVRRGRHLGVLTPHHAPAEPGQKLIVSGLNLRVVEGGARRLHRAAGRGPHGGRHASAWQRAPGGSRT